MHDCNVSLHTTQVALRTFHTPPFKFCYHVPGACGKQEAQYIGMYDQQCEGIERCGQHAQQRKTKLEEKGTMFVTTEANIAHSSRSVPSSNAVFLSEVQLLFSIACSISSPLPAMHLKLVDSCSCDKINKCERKCQFGREAPDLHQTIASGAYTSTRTGFALL